MSSDSAIVRDIDIEDVTGPDAFQAWGYALLKFQRGDETIRVRVKVRSIPQAFIDKLNDQRPRPPSRRDEVTPEEGRRLGATTRGRAFIPDLNDVTYQRSLDEFNGRFTREIVGLGVVSAIRFPDGRPAETPEEKYRALEAHGLSASHFTELMNTILHLTDFSEEERAGFTKTG